MTHKFKALTGFVLLVSLAACAPAPAPEPVYAQPVFDKFGNAIVAPVQYDEDGNPIAPAGASTGGNQNRETNTSRTRSTTRAGG